MSPRDISPKGQTQERCETHAGQSIVQSSSAGLAGLRVNQDVPDYPGSVEALDYISP